MSYGFPYEKYNSVFYYCIMKRLHNKSWKEVQAEMSIAGDAEKITKLSQEIMEAIVYGINTNQIPEIANMQFGLQRIIAELKTWERKERSMQSVPY